MRKILSNLFSTTPRLLHPYTKMATTTLQNIIFLNRITPLKGLTKSKKKKKKLTNKHLRINERHDQFRLNYTRNERCKSGRMEILSDLFPFFSAPRKIGKARFKKIIKRRFWEITSSNKQFPQFLTNAWKRAPLFTCSL